MTDSINDALAGGIGIAFTAIGASIAFKAIDNFLDHPRRKKKRKFKI